jgi:hypothetical protein
VLSHESAAAANSAGSPAFPHEQSPARILLQLADMRAWAVILGLAAAILLPEFTLSGRLPAVRAEQLLLPYGVLVFWVDRLRRSPYRPGFVDWVFLGLGASTLCSIIAAPLILRSRLSPRDFYELAKVALYYTFYRLARESCTKSLDAMRVLGMFLAAGTVCTLFAVAQYFNWLGVNAWLTPLFAPEPHLGVLRQSGRVVGAIGNPNYLGIFCAMLALGALLTYWIRPRTRAVCVWPILVAAPASLALVMSGSRTALLALAGATLALILFAALARRSDLALPRLVAGCAALLVLLLSSIVVVEVFPRGQVDYLGRIGGGLTVNDDASFGLRLARWRSFIAAWLPQGSTGDAASHAPLTSVHTTGVRPATPEVLARDAQRKSDLLRLATAIDAYHRSTGKWPDASKLADALVPRYLTTLPNDPATGEPYADVQVVTGYSLFTRLEDAADPDYPIYGIGSSPNYLLNGDLERGGAHPSDWEAIPGSGFTSVRVDALFGDRSVAFRGNPDRPQLRGGIFQQRYFGRPGGNPFTATVWLKLPQQATGQLELYANVIYADGERADPLTRIPADISRTGVWQKVSLGILPPAGKTIAFLGVYVVSDGFRGEALLDGFQLVDGPVPLTFALTREAPPSDTLGFNPEARLRRSPVIGVGPEKGQQGSSVDDEYLLYAARYGVVGFAIYLALYLGTLILALRATLAATSPARRRLAALVASTLVAFLIFNLTAGSFYELQLMAIFWLITGVALSRPERESE